MTPQPSLVPHPSKGGVKSRTNRIKYLCLYVPLSPCPP
jgi:hypothetical protein